MFVGFVGQPGRLIISFRPKASETPTAPVGLGAAATMPPSRAQEPTAKTSAASFAHF